MSSRHAFPIAALLLGACQLAPPPPVGPAGLGGFTLDVYVPPASVPVDVSAAPAGPADGVAGPGPGDAPPPAALAPTAEPSPSAAPSAAPTARPGSGGGSSGGGSSGETGVPLTIRDAFGQPVAGAVLTLADGSSYTTGADGVLRYPGSFPLSRAAVAHPEYVPSLALDLDAADVLHLRPAGGRSGAFDERTTRVEGRVDWPLADLRNTAATFQADRPVFGLNGTVQPADGTFAVDVVTAAPGDPVGSLVLAGGDGAGTLLYGVSATFSPFTDPAPGPVALVRADQPVAYALAAPPADLADVTSRIELTRPGAPPVVLASRPDADGTWLVPAPGALPGTVRVAFEARSADGRRESVASLVPEAGSAEATLLAPVAATLDAATRTVAWTPVAGADGYLIELVADGQAGTAWEAWTASGAALTVPEALWPAAGEVVVRAIDAPGFTSRSIASLPEGPRRLRLEPWTGADTYRVATTRLRF